MSRQFAQYLASKGKLSPTSPGICQSLNEFREVVGAIALRHELMTPSQIDEVILETSSLQTFHEIAQARGYLDAKQVDRLLRCQAVENALHVGVAAVLSGEMSCEEMLQEMAEYFGAPQNN